MTKKYLFFAAAVLFIVSGCSRQTGSPIKTEAALESQVPDPQATLNIDYPGPGDHESSPVDPYPVPPTEVLGLTPYPEPEVSVSSATSEPAPIKDDLVATDPALVNLAPGKPTFVEFFAFW